jgi:hypothetical protein
MSDRNFNMDARCTRRAVQLALPQDDALQDAHRPDRVGQAALAQPRRRQTTQERFPRVKALLTQNIREATAALTARGLIPTQPLRDPDPVIGVQGVVCFADPDGHIVELIEYFPGQLGSNTDKLPKRSGQNVGN